MRIFVFGNINVVSIFVDVKCLKTLLTNATLAVEII